MLVLEFTGHQCPVIEEEIFPEGPSDKIVVHVVLGHLDHCGLDVDVEVGPGGRIARLVGVVEGREVGGHAVQVTSKEGSALGVGQSEREDAADALRGGGAESEVRLDGVGEGGIAGYAVEELGVCEVELYPVPNCKKITRVLLVAAIVVVLFTGEEGQIVVRSREDVRSPLLHIQQSVSHVRAVNATPARGFHAGRVIDTVGG